MGATATAPPTPPRNRVHQECLAFRDTFFNTNTMGLMLINFLLAFVPLGIAAGWLGWGCLSIFGFNFLAIIPLSAFLGASTEALSKHTGQVLGGLLNATLGNAVEMSVTLFAIRKGMVEVVQMSLIGSLLSNLLLVLGMSFIAAGFKNHQSAFNATGASSAITCLVLASLALTLPTVYTSLPGTTSEETILLSRIIACVMGFVYICFIYFQLSTHADFFEVPNESPLEIAKLNMDENRQQDKLREQTVSGSFLEPPPPVAPVQEYELSLWSSLFVLLVTTGSVMTCSEFLVQSIDKVSADYNMPYAFIGLILLPIVGNAAEHTTAVTAAYHDLMDLSLSVAVGSSTQVALFVIPYSVIIGWCYGVPVGLDFHIFSATVFLLSVFIASGVLSDGSGNWFEGTMLCATYTIVAIITWFLPDGHHTVTIARSLESAGIGGYVAI